MGGCNFECLYEIENKCLLDKEECDDRCERHTDCRYCERTCDGMWREKDGEIN